MSLMGTAPDSGYWPLNGQQEVCSPFSSSVHNLLIPSVVLSECLSRNSKRTSCQQTDNYILLMISLSLLGAEGAPKQADPEFLGFHFEFDIIFCRRHECWGKLSIPNYFSLLASEVANLGGGGFVSL